MERIRIRSFRIKRKGWRGKARSSVHCTIAAPDTLRPPSSIYIIERPPADVYFSAFHHRKMKLIPKNKNRRWYCRLREPSTPFRRLLGRVRENLIAAPPPLFSLNVAGFSFSDVLFLNFIRKLGADSVVQFCENCKLSQVSRVKLKFDINSIKCRKWMKFELEAGEGV